MKCEAAGFPSCNFGSIGILPSSLFYNRNYGTITTMLKRHKMDDFPLTSRQLRERHGYEKEQPEFALEEVGTNYYLYRNKRRINVWRA